MTGQTEVKKLEDHQPGASRSLVLDALKKVAKSHKPTSNGNGNGKTSHAQREKEIVKQAIDVVIEKNLEAFKELERY